MSLIKVSHKFLLDCGIHVSKTYFNHRMQSHPDAGFLISFTDTLDELGIKYKVVKVDNLDSDQLSFPFLAQLGGVKTKYDIISSLSYLQSNIKSLKDKWNGVSVMIDAGQHSTNNDSNLSQLKLEKSETSILQAVILTSILMVSIISSYNFDLISFGFIWFSVLGLSVCSLIIMHKLGKENSVTQKLCNIDTASCNHVINSRYSNLSQNIDIADVGLVYFTSILLFSLLLKIMNYDNYILLFIPCFLALITSFVSIFYQWKIIKVWCKLCILIISIIWLQFGMLYLQFSSNDFEISMPNYSVVLLFIVAVILSSLWFLIKPLFKLKSKNEKLDIQLSRWKRNPEIFKLLLKQRSVSNTFIENSPFNFGSPNALINITMASGITCSPCAKAHEKLERLYQKYIDKISVSIIFSQKEFDPKKDKKAVVIANLINLAKATDPLKVISDWYKTMNVEAMLQTTSIPYYDEGVEHILNSFDKWNTNNMISGTPTFFINGYQIPHVYELNDIESFIPEICDGLLQKEIQIHE